MFFPRLGPLSGLEVTSGSRRHGKTVNIQPRPQRPQIHRLHTQSVNMGGQQLNTSHATFFAPFSYHMTICLILHQYLTRCVLFLFTSSFSDKSELLLVISPFPAFSSPFLPITPSLCYFPSRPIDGHSRGVSLQPVLLHQQLHTLHPHALPFMNLPPSAFFQ